MPLDHRDFALEMFADENARAEARIVSLEADVDSYRALAQEAIHALHRLTQQHRRQGDSLRALLGAERES